MGTKIAGYTYYSDFVDFVRNNETTIGITGGKAREVSNEKDIDYQCN